MLHSVRRAAALRRGLLAPAGAAGRANPTRGGIVVCTRLKSGRGLYKQEQMRAYTKVRNPTANFDHHVVWTDEDERNYQNNRDAPQPAPLPYETLVSIAVRTQEEKEMLKKRIPRSQHLEMLSFRQAHGLKAEKERLPVELMMEDSRDLQTTRQEKHDYLTERKEAELALDQQKYVDAEYLWKARAGIVQDAGLSVPYWGWDDELSQLGPSPYETAKQAKDRANWDEPSMMLPITRFKENYKNPRSNDCFVPGRRLKYEIEADYEKDPQKNTPKVLADKYGITRDQVRGIIILKHCRDTMSPERKKVIEDTFKKLEPTREDLPFLPSTQKMPNVSIRDAIDAHMGCDPRMNIEPHVLRAPDRVTRPVKSPLPTFLSDAQLEELLEKEKPGIKFRPDLVDRTFWPQRQCAANMLPKSERVVKGSTDMPKMKAERSFAFVDMSRDATASVRRVVKRENDGILRDCDFLARRRLNQKANPRPNYKRHSWLERNESVYNKGEERFQRLRKKEWESQPCVQFFNQLRAEQAGDGHVG